MDFRLRLDGALDEIYEPLWKLQIQLTDEEKALLRSKKVRRLHYIRHGGASFINTHHTYSRLQHTLGVFALTAHFEPDNRTLRAAALLHDIGHAPFSHTLEALPGVDHHEWTREAVFSQEIVDILARANIRTTDVMDYIDGSKRSLLRNKDGILHADHLDSWVRSAFVGGYLTISTGELLEAMSYRNENLQFTLEAGKQVTELIWVEARMHASPANIGVNAIMRKLAGRLIHKDEFEAAKLPIMTDTHIEQLLCSNPDTREEYEQLLMESWRIRVSRAKPAFPVETAVLSKLYLAMPLIQGVVITEYSQDCLATVNQLTELLGTYYVWWEC
ncbi:HD domain-containing protein [Paenibacillus silagei]|uniref:HD superfamily phosphohydrolase n=1 Tax=Paenibacillus silagei TaxID=1670801 RepID=A0ABS4NVG8_9BACL|nr:HD domain-containing protein [Paenibacillus silagei]MBP2114046.1 HD superfamily phosphohydrolase [Paenibacillus silagei]